MARSTVNGQLLSPLAAMPAAAQVTITLVDYDDTPAVGFDTVDQAEVLSSAVLAPASSGAWTMQLAPNADIQLTDGSAQTAYRVTESGDGTTYTYWIIVTASSPAWAGALRTTLVGTSGGTAAAMAIAGGLTVGGDTVLDGNLTLSAAARADIGLPLAPSGDTTGATDHTAIQGAINAAQGAGEGIVRLGAGTFITTLLTLPSDVILEGAGSGATVVQLAAAQNTDLIQTSNFSTLTGTDTSNTPYGYQVRGLTLDGNKANQSSGTGNCLSSYAYGFRLLDVVARNAMGFGIWSEWGSASPFLAPNGMESFASGIKVHDCNSGAVTFIGPHDSQWSDMILVQNTTNYTLGSGKAAFSVPTDGRANGSVFSRVHVYGAQYDYGVLAASAGTTFADCEFEGAQVAQAHINASQVNFAGCRWFWGGGSANTSKGVTVGDASHTNINCTRIVGKVENLTGGAIDATYGTGGGSRYEVQANYVSPFATPTALFIGTPASSDYVAVVGSDNNGATLASSVVQIPTLAKLSSLAIAGITIPANVDQDPLGYGYATTAPQPSGPNGSAAGSANFAYYQQLIGYGMTAAGLRIYVANSSGNVSVGLYTNGGQSGASRLPLTQQATSGAVACPAIGQATVNFTASATVGRSWYAALSVDNGTATFYRSAPQSTISDGVAANQGTAHPLPATANAANGGGFVPWMATP